MVHGENRIPYWIDRRLTGLAGIENLNMMPPSRLDCPMSLKSPNMGNTGLEHTRRLDSKVVVRARRSHSRNGTQHGLHQ